MVRAWFYNENKELDQRDPHYPEPFQAVPLSYLTKLGVTYWKCDPLNYEADTVFTTVRSERGYKNHDVVDVGTLPNLEEKLKIFFDEHLHDDEEARFFLEGSGFFDIRDELTQKWIRIECVSGDLIVLPAGTFHRFTLDYNNKGKAMRLFKDEPKWTAYSRTLEETSKREAREQYLAPLEKLQEKFNGEAVILSNKAKSLANYPHARIVDGKVYFSGTSSRKADNTHAGAKLAEDGVTWELDIKEQTAAVLENIRWILQQSGSDLHHLISITVFLVNMEDYQGYNEVYNLYFDAESGPARTTVAVKELPHPNLLIEIQGIAAVANQRENL